MVLWFIATTCLQKSLKLCICELNVKYVEVAFLKMEPIGELKIDVAKEEAKTVSRQIELK
jgi:hypothetical protein